MDGYFQCIRELQIKYISINILGKIYDLVLFIFRTGILIASLLGNRKAHFWIQGRRNWEDKIKISLDKAGKNRVWFHCASLGEFEQGRPLIEKLKSYDPSLFIVLSFFSPSGYELRKNYPQADLICYLPVDTKTNATKFINLVSPSYVVFIKYEFWHHYFETLKRENIPLFLASVLFRPSQLFFKWYGSFYRKILKNVTHFFVQDENSAKLLAEFGFTNSTVTGDTRFDRVQAISLEKNKISILDKFKRNNKLFIAGSSWPEDENIFLPALNYLIANNYKVVIAPHEISEKRIQQIILKASEYFSPNEITCFSSNSDPELAKVLIIDNIGILSSAYSYGTIAWIGGGFGKGIHNILEAAVFGIPVIFGPEYKKFNEANELIELEGAYTVKNIKEAVQIFAELAGDEHKMKKSTLALNSYILSKLGSTDKIISHLPDLTLNHTK